MRSSKFRNSNSFALGFGNEFQTTFPQFYIGPKGHAFSFTQPVENVFHVVFIVSYFICECQPSSELHMDNSAYSYAQVPTCTATRGLSDG